MTAVRDQLFFPQKTPGSRFRFSRTGVQPSPGSSTIELPSALAESGMRFDTVRAVLRGHQKDVFRRRKRTTFDVKNSTYFTFYVGHSTRQGISLPHTATHITTSFSTTTDSDIYYLLYVISLNTVFKNQLLHRGGRLPMQRRWCSTHHVATILK